MFRQHLWRWYQLISHSSGILTISCIHSSPNSMHTTHCIHHSLNTALASHIEHWIMHGIPHCIGLNMLLPCFWTTHKRENLHFPLCYGWSVLLHSSRRVGPLVEDWKLIYFLPPPTPYRLTYKMLFLIFIVAIFFLKRSLDLKIFLSK